MANWDTSSSCREQGKERGSAGLGEAGILQPLSDPDDVQGSSGEDVLESGLGQADGASVAKVADSQPLGERSLHPAPDVIALLEARRPLILSGGLPWVGP